jgi:solute:Na+ symporter, SSS family
LRWRCGSGRASGRIAAAHDLRTVGDLLEWRYDHRVRAIVAMLLWVGTIAILVGQLIGIAWILTVVIGIPKAAGCLIGAGVAVAYFGAGGLLSSAVVNVVQLTVKILGFAVALPSVVAKIYGARDDRAVRVGVGVMLRK